MIDYKEWKLFKEAEMNKQFWGYEITGSVAEIIKILQKVPQDRECVVSLSFKKYVPPTKGGTP